MSLLKDIQIFIATNPGLTNKEIAASMPQYDVHAVQRGVCHLVKLNRATSERHLSQSTPIMLLIASSAICSLYNAHPASITASATSILPKHRAGRLARGVLH